MGNTEKNIIENIDYIRKTNVSDFHAGQSGSGVENEESLKKELKEDSFGKASMMEVLADRLVGELSLPENYKIMDEVLEVEGAAQELANHLWKYSEKLGSKNIIPSSSAYDMFRNLYMPLLGFIHTFDDRTKKIDKLGFIEDKKREADENDDGYKKLKNRHEQLKNAIESSRNGIVRGYNELKDYLGLMENYKNFETAELNSQHGYLTGKMDNEELESLKANRRDYIKRCELELTKN